MAWRSLDSWDAEWRRAQRRRQRVRAGREAAPMLGLVAALALAAAPFSALDAVRLGGGALVVPAAILAALGLACGAVAAWLGCRRA